MANKTGNRLTVRTREALIHAYLELFQESPTKNITITDICERAGLSRPTFYKHFQTKEEILESYLDTLLEEMFTKFRERGLPNFPHFMDGAAHFFSLWRSKADIYRLIKESGTEHVLLEKLKDHHLRVYHSVIADEFTINDPEILEFYMSHLTYVFYSALDQWMAHGMKRSPREMAELLSIVFDPYAVLPISEKYG